MKTGIFGTVSMLALACPALGLAQPAPASPAGQDEEIVVTAQKVTQNVQRVPLAIEVLSSAQLELKGVSSLYSLDRDVAGLHIFDLGPSVNVMIRGVGNQSALSTSDPTAAFNVDGVYRSRATSLNGVMYDLSRVEVVKGPMGTLYGRNATTGAVNVITNAPTQTQEASGTVEYGNFNQLRATGMLNTPLSDNTALRVAFGFLRHDGYQTDGYDDADQVGVRARLKYAPSDDFSMLLTADYASQNGYGQGNAIQDPAKLGAAPNPLYAVPAGASPWYGNEKPGNLRNRDSGVALEVNKSLGWADLFLEPSYRRSTSMNRGFTSGSLTGIVNDFTSDQYMAEARLSSPATSPIKWVTGLYYYNEALNNNTALTVVASPVVTVPASDRLRNYTVPSLDTTSYAAFGQTTFPIVVERLRATGGLRYTYDKRSLSGSIYSTEFNALTPDIVTTLTAAQGFPPAALSADANFHHVDWKAGVEFDVASQSMFYASAGTGYKAGGLNAVNGASTGPIQAAPTYSPETLMEYTAGLKNRLFDNRVTLNLSYFKWIYSNRQGLNAGAGGGVVTSNLTGSGAALANPAVCFAPPAGIVCNFPNISSGKQYIQGVDVDGNLRVTANDRVGFTVAWLDGKYGTDSLNAGPAAGGTNAGLGAVDLRGRTLAFSPRWSANLDYTHDFALANGAVVSLFLAAETVSSQYVSNNLGQSPNPAAAPVANPIGARATFQPAYVVGDASLNYTAPTSRYSASLWIRNIGNEAVKSAAALAILSSGVGTGLAGITNPVWLDTLRPPRTFGASVSVKF